MSKKKTVDIRQNDYYRALLTETIPVELPLFVSNVGLYNWCKHNAARLSSSMTTELTLADTVLSAVLNGKKNSTATRPYEYEVRVRPTKQRRLAIAHPRAQLRWVDLYRDRNPLFIHYCNRSDWSLRAPYRIANRTYIPNPDQNLYKLKLNSAGVDVESDQWRHKYASSFFSYRGHRRLYRFFESEEFLRLEQRFPTLWMLDIHNCFGSIYTHSVTWAIRTRSQVKRNIRSSNSTFGGELDASFRNANWAETAGILVGPELSRIFAEIILQDVDIRVLRALEDQNCHRQYTIRRYVDDYFVFATNEVVAEKVVQQVERELANYNLQLNTSKTARYSRPFITEKSLAIEKAKDALDYLANATVSVEVLGEQLDADIDALTRDEQGALEDPIDAPRQRRRIRPKAIRSIRRLKASTIRKIKSICANNPAGYDLIGGYMFPALANMLVKLFEVETDEIANPNSYQQVTQLVLELMFFLYAVSPSVGHSVRLANACLLSLSFFRASGLTTERENIEEIVYRGCTRFLEESSRLRTRPSTAGLEELNMVTLLGQLGRDYDVPWDVLRRWIAKEQLPLSNLGYFELTVAMQYMRDKAGYEDARAELGNAIVEKVEKASSDAVQNSAEFALMLLDFLSCQWLEPSRRALLMKSAIRKLEVRKPKSNKEVSKAVECLESREWFSDWDDIYLFRSLQRSTRTGFY